MSNFATDGKICIERELLVTDTNYFEDVLTRFEILEICKWIKHNNFTKVCLQFPDDLLNSSVKIYEEIKSRCDIDLYILGDTSYASCCIDTVAAMHVQANAIVHFGHSCFSKANIPVFTVLPKRDLGVESVGQLLKNVYESDEEIKLCLFYDPELEHCRDKLENHWYQLYPNSYIAFVAIKDQPDRFLGRVVKNEKGEVLSITTLKDCICIYLGVRGQTLFNYSIGIEAKKWQLLNTDSCSLEHIDETAWFKRRRFLIEKCKDANVVGILVCQLAGDQTKDIVSRMKQLCRANGKKSYIVSVGKPNVAKLANFPEIDVYVMIACPENDLYSSRDFYKPIVYPFELEVALNPERPSYFTNHVTDYNELMPGKQYYCEIGNVQDTTDVSLVTGKIRETRVNSTSDSESRELVEKQNWALENIGQNLQERSWKGLEQKLGQTEVKKAEEGRKGIPIQYINEPK